VYAGHSLGADASMIHPDNLGQWQTNGELLYLCQVPPPPPPKQPGCSAVGLPFLRCSDLGLLVLWLVIMAALWWAFVTPKVRRQPVRSFSASSGACYHVARLSIIGCGIYLLWFDSPLSMRQGSTIMFGAPMGVSESGVLTETLWPSKYDRGSMSGFSDDTDAPVVLQQTWARRRLSSWYRWQVGMVHAPCSTCVQHPMFICCTNQLTLPVLCQTPVCSKLHIAAESAVHAS
jgi:hypothetical protein